MKLLALSLVLAAACGGTKPPPPSPIVPEGPPVSEYCCCKSTPATSVDGKPVYQPKIARMECSTRQGTCEDDLQCRPTDSGDN